MKKKFSKNNFFSNIHYHLELVPLIPVAMLCFYQKLWFLVKHATKACQISKFNCMK